MNEKRLLEITSTISMLDGPLVILGYLSTLSESDMYLFLKYVRGSKYCKENFYDAIKLFSQDYLKDKDVLEINPSIEKLGYSEGNYEDYFEQSGFSQDYYDNFAALNDVVNVVNHKK